MAMGGEGENERFSMEGKGMKSGNGGGGRE